MSSQLFFDNRHYFGSGIFSRRRASPCRRPGHSAISPPRQIKRFVGLCGAELPAALLSELERRGDDDEAVSQFGIEYATRQCEELLREGAPGLHFYTLNKARSTTAVIRNLALARRSIGEAALR